jgi:glycosyltransferase involved in cell wall biosynthesis
MKIAIDASALAINRFSGLAQVVQNLTTNISQIKSFGQLYLYINYFIANTTKSELCFPNTVSSFLRLPRRLVNFWWNFGWPSFDSYLKNIDIFHSLHIDIPPAKKMKTILTVHDCRYLAYPDLYKDYEIANYRKQMETSLKRVDMVVAVSEFTRLEIEKYFSFPSERIKVVHNGFKSIQGNNNKAEKKAEKFIEENNLPKSYLLYIGASDPRKNLNRFIDVMYRCIDKIKNFPHLLIIGTDFQNWMKSEIGIKIKNLKLSKYVHLCGILDTELLIGLTQKAHVLCYPSLYEGFGFPPLEAMSLGVPVLAGNCSAIPEISGNAACLVDPLCIDDIERGLRKIVFDSEYRKNLVIKGYNQIRKFSWTKSATEYIRVYREVLNK